MCIRDSSNYSLSTKRAQSAVEYILNNSNIRKGRIQARGYGESDLVNGCKNGVKCSDRKHQQNRRTELKILGITEYDPFADKSLEAIIKEENFEETLVSIQNQEVVQFAEGEVPEEILAQIKAQEKGRPSASSSAKVPTSQASSPSPTQASTTSQPTKAPIPTRPSFSTSDKKDMPSMANSTKEMSNKANDLVGENEPEVDLSLDTKIPNANVGASVPEGEFELDVDMSYAKPLGIPKSYTGFVVEFFRAKSHLPSEHPIFQKHGNIVTDVLGDGSVSYMLGDYKNKSDAEKFMKHIVSKQYSKAKIISYQKGRRS